MKKLIYSVLIVFAISTMSSAQTSFDKDMTNLHSDIFRTCGMIKSKEAKDDAKILQSLAGLKDEISSLQMKYAKNPPQEYAKDPMFGSYFFQFKDVVDNLSERVKRSDYKAAIMNCSNFCMTFNKMHLINGQLDLTDIMFMWNMQITMTNYMIAADNYKGAKMNVQKIPALYQLVLAQKNKKNSPDFNKQFETLNAAYQQWLKAIEEKDYKAALAESEVFNGAFPRVFMNSL